MKITEFYDLKFMNHEEDGNVDDLGAGHCVAWRPDTEEREHCLAYSGSEGQLKVWRILNPATWMSTFQERIAFAPSCCAWSPCGRVLAVTLWSYNDRTTLLYNRGDQFVKLFSFYKGHTPTEEDKFSKLSWNKSGSMLATCGNRDICIWKINIENLVLRPQQGYSFCKPIMTGNCGGLPRGYVPTCEWYIDPSHDLELIAYLQATHAEDVNNVQWHPKTDILFSCGSDATVKLWTEQRPDGQSNWQCAQTIGHDSTVWSLSINANGHRMVTSSDDGTLQIWATENAELEEFGHWIHMHTLARCHDGPIFSVHWSSEGFIATGAAAGMIGIYGQNHENGAYKLLLLKICHGDNVNSVQWSPVDLLLASTGADETIKIWELDQLNEEVDSNHPEEAGSNEWEERENSDEDL